MTKHLKPKLSIEEQLDLLEARGVTFKYRSKAEAIESLSKTNNYFKLTAYRKNFETNSKGHYLNLDFAYLKDLSKIDMHLRYCLLLMCLDVEHFAKAKLMTFITQSDEDGYSIVQEHMTLPPTSRFYCSKERYNDIFRKAEKNDYCKDIYIKHKDDMPIWALIELIPFGTFVNIYGFVAEKHNNKPMLNEFYILKDISKLRNACAHNNCILNDLSTKTRKYNPSYDITRDLSKHTNKDVYQSKLRNPRIYQITCLLYLHKTLITSGLHDVQSKNLNTVISYMFANSHYYEDNSRLKSIFDYFKKC
ncbi:MAG: Abi family protein [Christensenellaceae bacterium]|nr:Abi family protein [Christensenellaceae bacterium]